MKISFIVPVYNVEDYVYECIISLIKQTIKDIEIIIVNDGSTDKSIEKIKEIKDNRINIINKENGGLSSARNVGIVHAKGDYIAFIDSDDFIGLNTAYEDMYKIAINNQSDIVSGGAIKYYSQRNKESCSPNLDITKFSNKTLNGEEFLLESIKFDRYFIPVWLNLYKRQFILNNKLTFKEGIYHEDEDFTPRTLFRANKVSIYDNDFYVYRQRVGSIIQSSNRQKYIDKLNIFLGLESELNNIKNEELRRIFKNRIAQISISIIYEYKIKHVSDELKKMIRKNIGTKGGKVRSNLLNLNSTLYINTERIYRKLRKIN